MSARHPFQTGNAVGHTDFFDRRKLVRRTVGRILRGESTAIIGSPRIGKTSFLLYLSEPEIRSELYGTNGERMLFKFIDSTTLGSKFTQNQFWEEALSPIREAMIDMPGFQDLTSKYWTSESNGFGNFTLQHVFRQLQVDGWRLVILLDEFDLLLHHQVLNSTEFFGGLRMLASTQRGALVLVIASSLPLADMNKLSQGLNPSGSPFFNTFAELVLCSFPENDVKQLLSRGDSKFATQDIRSIRQLAGGHPFLLQAAAAAMWEAHEDNIEGSTERRRVVGQRLYHEYKHFFSSLWTHWTPEMKQAFTVVGLAQADMKLHDRQFNLEEFAEDLKNWNPELCEMENCGLLVRDASISIGWRVTQEVMVWWLATELQRAIRSDSDFAQWLRNQEMDGRWTKSQKDQVSNIVKGLGQGASKLIEVFVMAFGAGLGDAAGGD